MIWVLNACKGLGRTFQEAGQQEKRQGDKNAQALLGVIHFRETRGGRESLFAGRISIPPHFHAPFHPPPPIIFNTRGCGEG